MTYRKSVSVHIFKLYAYISFFFFITGDFYYSYYNLGYAKENTPLINVNYAPALKYILIFLR